MNTHQTTESQRPALRLLWRRVRLLLALLLCCAAAVACGPEKKQDFTPPPDETAKVGDTLPALTFATCDGSKSYTTTELANSSVKLLLLTGHSMW